MKKVVTDTNVLISALLFGGVPGALVSLWKSGRIRPLYSGDMAEEYLRVLAYPKFSLSEEEIDFLFSQEILPWFQIVAVTPDQPFVIADPSDDKFISCAVEGKADLIISGDEHLLDFTPSPVPVVSPSQFLEEHGY
jgi:putative PIN family toxin of toxin-antitoxin system